MRNKGLCGMVKLHKSQAVKALAELSESQHNANYQRLIRHFDGGF
jgi:hypothetical protein